MTSMGFNHGDSSPSGLPESVTHICNQSMGYVNSLSLKCAVELGIPETIRKHGQAMPLADLTSALPIHPTKSKYLPRLMAHLVHIGFFQVHNNDPNQQAYSLTPASALLVKESPYDCAALVSLFTDPEVLKPFMGLSNWFQNDISSAFKTYHGEGFYDKCRKDPRLDRSMNEGMASDSKLVCKTVVTDCREMFNGLKSLVDVGGGTGVMGRAIADAFPHLECTVFDQPHVVAGLQGKQNLKFVGGNMFECIPSADAILLKNLLVDWGDENCVKILKRCKEAITKGGRAGKLIIMEIVMGHMKWDKESVLAQLLFDMSMMAHFEGKNRSEAEWSKLFSEARFSSYKIHPVLGIRALIEVFP